MQVMISGILHRKCGVVSRWHCNQAQSVVKLQLASRRGRPARAVRRGTIRTASGSGARSSRSRGPRRIVAGEAQDRAVYVDESGTAEQRQCAGNVGSKDSNRELRSRSSPRTKAVEV